jgi:hypothetical protein
LVSKLSTAEPADELPDLRRTLRVGGHLVFVKCFAVKRGRACRYEVDLRGGGRVALVDLPHSARAQLEARIDEALGAFAESLRLASVG